MFFSALLKQRHENLWHSWIYILGSKETAKKFRSRIKVSNPDGSESITYNGPVQPLDLEEMKVIASSACLTVTDSTVERLMVACPDQTKVKAEADELKFLLRIAYSVIESKAKE